MRLFRRSLLCVVVGVTAFGVAGWGFRPKPNWTVAVSASPWYVFGLKLLDSPGNIRDSDVVSLLRWRTSDKGLEDAQVESFDAHAGKSLSRIIMPEEFNDPKAFEGGIAIAASRPRGLGWDNSIKESKFRTFDLREGRLIGERSFAGEWHETEDGAFVWSLEKPSGREARLLVRSLEDGSVLHSLALPGPAPAQAFVSQHAERCAINRRGDIGVEWIEIWDLSSRERLCQVRSPMPPEGMTWTPWAKVRFEASENRVHWEWPAYWSKLGMSTHWELDVAAGKLTAFDLLAPPEPGAEIDEELALGTGSERLAVATRREPPRTWLALCEGNDRRANWREVPFPLKRRHQSLCGLSSLSYGVGAEFTAIPGGRGVVVTSVEPDQFATYVPESLRQRFFPRRSLGEMILVHRWHDPSTDRWRPIGLENAFQIQVHDHGIIALVRDKDGTTLLQSWPLPPRDPKWPALGVAALCAAGTWWACARRYQRKMQVRT